MALNIAPPKEHLELGDKIRYHHRACVARIPKSKYEPGIFGKSSFEPKWETINKEGGSPPVYSWQEDNWLSRMPTDVKRNKTIVIWHEIGEGFIYGMIRRGIGTSYSGYTSGYETPEYEPGWFDPHEWHWLYAVKCHLSGLQGIYVPIWAAEKIRGN